MAGIAAGGAAVALVDVAGRSLNVEVVEHKGLTWYDLQQPTLAEIEYLAEHFPFHPLELDDIRSRVQLPKLDEYPSYIFLVLHFPIFDQRMRLTRPSQVSLFVGESYVVTVHDSELRPLTKLFHDCQQSDEVRGEVMGYGSGLLLYRVLDALVDYCFPILNKLITQVDGLETRILDWGSRNLLRELAFVRRDVLSYRRVVRPQIGVLESLERREYSFIKLNADVYFGDLADHMRRLSSELEDLKEVVEGLQDTYTSVTSQQTNRVIRLLTLFASFLLPMTVVTGFYGMNIQLPGMDTSWIFMPILAAMLALPTGLLLLLWKRDWL